MGRGGLGNTHGDRPGLAQPPAVTGRSLHWWVIPIKRAGAPAAEHRPSVCTLFPTPLSPLTGRNNKIHLTGWWCDSSEILWDIASEISERPGDGGCCNCVISRLTPTPTTQTQAGQSQGLTFHWWLICHCYLTKMDCL